jgi:hypothetical protein
MSENKPQQVPSVGRVVHYVLDAGPSQGEHRPAVIVRVYPDPDGEVTPGAVIIVHVHVDSHGDYYPHQGDEPLIVQRMPGYDPDGTIPGSWHWPEFVPAKG